MRILRNQGWVCTRSAMSHGPIDIIAARTGKILLIQVKSGSARAKKDEKNLMKMWAKAFSADAQVWSFRKRGKIEKIDIWLREKQPVIISSLSTESELPTLLV